MGYLSNTELTVDAILTKEGRAKLAQGQGLGITKFALADDEIDYTLYEPAHPNGSAYYDYAIKNIPVMEASPDGTQCMKYKLFTSDADIVNVPTINIAGFEAINYTYQISQINNTNLADTNFTPSTTGVASEEYIVVIGDTAVADITGTPLTSQYSVPGTQFGSLGVPKTLTIGTGGTLAQSIKIMPKKTITTAGVYTTTLTITGVTSGASLSIPVTLTVTA